MTKTTAQRMKETRLKKRIQTMLQKYKCLFITMTFNDATINATNKETRERYIKDFLNHHTALYIANKDYCKRTKREHYHAIITTCTLKLTSQERRIYSDALKFNLNAYKYGFIQYQKIACDWKIKGDKDFSKMASQLMKHFFKDTTNGARVIYSRKAPSDAEQQKRLKTYNNRHELTEEEIINDALNHNF